MAQETELKVKVTPEGWIPDIAAIARPGDTLMVAFNRTLTDAELDELREAFEGFTDTTGVHVGFIEQASAMVVVRPEGEPDGVVRS